MDETIRIGLDFGTHQTKVCVRRAYDEGAGPASYDFFQFKDLNGDMQYILPSIVQLNTDDTLSYGFVDPKREKRVTNMLKPEMEKPEEPVELSDDEIEDLANELFDRYEVGNEDDKDINILIRLLETVEAKKKENYAKALHKARSRYDAQMLEYRQNGKIYRYFKQAMFAERPWLKDIDFKLLCIWYIAYIVFCLEKKFGQNFSLNMGIPADETNYEDKKKEAVSILLSAYWLVENEYEGDIDEFLSEKVESLKERTKVIPFSEESKEDYGLHVFPEAYAALVSQTSRGKIESGMSITADMGGGTTDITFFTVNNNELKLFKFYSLPYGLNYIAEKSGFDYSDGDFLENADADIIERFNNFKLEFEKNLKEELFQMLRAETGRGRSELDQALKDRVIVYSGGGSSYQQLMCPLSSFTDIKSIDKRLWDEENISNRKEITPLVRVLATAYGLTLEDSEDNVRVCKFTSLFSNISKLKTGGRDYIGKDQC